MWKGDDSKGQSLWGGGDVLVRIGRSPGRRPTYTGPLGVRTNLSARSSALQRWRRTKNGATAPHVFTVEQVSYTH